MYRSVELLSKYRAKIIWTTTFPISLAKYHKSQGWNIDKMQQYVFTFKSVRYFDFFLMVLVTLVVTSTRQ